MVSTQVTRTYEARITNHSQVREDLDQLGWSASKLWNVARYYADERWENHEEIPDENELKRELKDHERYADLHSQSSQRVLEELAEAFRGWRASDEENNPPGYRKRGDEHPRSTVTFKRAGFKHDRTHSQIRLSKGRNLKQSRDDFVLCEYEARPDVEIDDVQQVRAVHENGTWRLQFVCRREVEAESPGEGVAGVDLGIDNYAAVAYPDEAVLYPGNALKEDKHYFTRQQYESEGRNGPSKSARKAKRKLARRRTHFLHALSKHVVDVCVEKGVGTIAVGNLGGVRKTETGDVRNWGSEGNKKLHGWEFARFTQLLEYKALERGIVVERVDESYTSQTCSVCGQRDEENRVERGLYVCEDCDTVANADVNGAENIRRKITRSPRGEDTSTGCLAQPSVSLFDKRSGEILPREQVLDRKP